MEKKVTPFAGQSSFAKEINSLVQTLSKNNASVLLIGERGTGKRLIAQHIHFSAAKNFGYFFEINCRSFTEAQVLGAFETVSKLIAYNQQITLFVCFADLLSQTLQSAFLELIKKSTEKGLCLKLISSVEKPLENAVSAGSFRSDLYCRLNSVVLNTVPLRQRKEDIIPIAETYLASFAKKSGYDFTSFSDGAKKAMLEHFWQGNVDELINAVQRAFIVGEPPVIGESDLALVSKTFGAGETIEKLTEDKSLKTAIDSFKREYLIKILEENNWNQTKTAQILGIQRTYVIRLMNELQIRR
ncbi:MAG: sigma-54-dependent Fis family transcriptional regulator [Treponema sp.]|nr:sigma-54-dependent Fis family transcriptional regulator [Treponema sp.]